MFTFDELDLAIYYSLGPVIFDFNLSCLWRLWNFLLFRVSLKSGKHSSDWDRKLDWNGLGFLRGVNAIYFGEQRLDKWSDRRFINAIEGCLRFHPIFELEALQGLLENTQLIVPK